jgi:hypothetical protein
VVQNQTNSESWQQLPEMPRKSWWARLPFGVRLTAGASAFLVVAGGGAVAVAVFTDQEPGIVVNAVGQATPGVTATGPVVPSAQAKLGEQPEVEEPAADSPEPRPTVTAGIAPADGGDVPIARPAEPAVAVAPVVTTRTVAETRKIPYQTKRVADPQLVLGEERVQTPGLDGVQTLRYRVTYVDGRPTDRRLLKTEITRPPQPRVVAFGTRPGQDTDGANGGADDNQGDGDNGGDASGATGNGDGVSSDSDDGDHVAWDNGDHGDGDDQDCWTAAGECQSAGRDAPCPPDGNQHAGDDWRHGEVWREGEVWNQGPGWGQGEGWKPDKGWKPGNGGKPGEGWKPGKDRKPSEYRKPGEDRKRGKDRKPGKDGDRREVTRTVRLARPVR